MAPQSLTQSIVAKLPFDWLYFDEMTCMHRAVQVKFVTAIPAVAVALLAGSSLSVDEDNFHRSSDQSSYGKDAFGHELSDRCGIVTSVYLSCFQVCCCSINSILY